HLRALLQLLRLFEIDLLEVILDLLNHFNDAPQPQVAGNGVELGADVVLRAIAVAGAFLDRLFHRLDDDGLVDHLFGRDGIRDREQFGLIGGNGTGHSGYAFSSSEISSISSAPLMSSGFEAAINLSVRTSCAE